jgi:hypothetical protein
MMVKRGLRHIGHRDDLLDSRRADAIGIKKPVGNLKDSFAGIGIPGSNH